MELMQKKKSKESHKSIFINFQTIIQKPADLSINDSDNSKSKIQIYCCGQVNSATKYHTLIYNGYIIFNDKVTLVDKKVSII